MARHNQLGQDGERLALQYLQAQGYAILDHNWHRGRYELDIVAARGREWVVVEVKSRGSDDFETPEEAVTLPKIRRIVAAAEAYALMKGWAQGPRFDIITVRFATTPPTVEHIEEAFYPPIG